MSLIKKNKEFRYIKNLLCVILICYCCLQGDVLRANSIIQEDRLFPTMTVATDKSAINHIREAQILIDLGEYDKSITYLNIISQRYTGNNKEVEARILGGLARNYLKLGLNRKAIQYWEDAIKRVEDSKDNAYLKAVFRNNMSLAYLNLDENEKAQENLLLSLKEYPIAQTYQKLSDLVLDKDKDFELSNFYLSSGLALINDPSFEVRAFGKESYMNKLIRATIIEGYAYHFYVKKDFKTALEKYNEVLTIAEDLKRVSLRLDVLKKLGYLNQEMDEAEKSSLYFADYVRLNDSLRVIKNNSLSIPMQHFLEENDEAPKKRANVNRSFIILLGTFISIALLIAIYSYLKRKKDLLHSEPLINEANNPNSNKNKHVDLILPTKTEEEILLKLKEFEASKGFLDKNMSFSRLVSHLDTNEKYFRQILKNNKDTDYNTYINGLRIQYIVNKLKTDPEYLNYKISYLAKEVAFHPIVNFQPILNELSVFPLQNLSIV